MNRHYSLYLCFSRDIRNLVTLDILLCKQPGIRCSCACVAFNHEPSFYSPLCFCLRNIVVDKLYLVNGQKSILRRHFLYVQGVANIGARYQSLLLKIVECSGKIRAIRLCRVRRNFVADIVSDFYKVYLGKVFPPWQVFLRNDRLSKTSGVQD